MSRRVLVQQHVDVNGVRRGELLPRGVLGTLRVRDRLLWRVDGPYVHHVNMQRRVHPNARQFLSTFLTKQHGFGMPHRILVLVYVHADCVQVRGCVGPGGGGGGGICRGVGGTACNQWCMEYYNRLPRVDCYYSRP